MSLKPFSGKRLKLQEFALLLLLTFLALLAQGYHPFAEDSETYLPGIEKLLHPNLFPFGREYFEMHAHLTVFPQAIAGSVWLTHLPLAWVLFFWQLAAIFLFLLACRIMTGVLFDNGRAIWGGVGLVAALLTLPVAGTALYIMDQYINPRNMTAFAVVFAVIFVLEKKYWRAALFLVLAALIHPFMTSFAVAYCVVLGWMGVIAGRQASPGPAHRSRSRVPAMTSLCVALPFVISGPVSSYRDVAISHAYQYFLQWRWYEMLGAVAPLFLLWWFRAMAKKQKPQSTKAENLALVCSSLVVYGAIFLFFGILFSSSRVFETIARLQPMRSLYLLYILFILIGGGLLAEHVLKSRPLRWMALFIPLCAGMYLAQRALFPASAHVEWPGATPKNPWVQAFQWARHNTPENTVFAINPEYMNLKGEDSNGFRAVAERSQLADAVKDAGVVEMFPALAAGWLKQVQAQTGLAKFTRQDFQRLRADYDVTWVILQQPATPPLDCPYANQAVKVCRMR